jgi:hypothetical protein
VSEELRIRLRRNRGKYLLPDFKEKLEAALGRPIGDQDFLDLEVSDRLRQQFFARVKSRADAFHWTWTPREEGEMRALVAKVAGLTQDLPAALFHALNDSLGAVIVPAGLALSRVGLLWPVLRQDLCLATLDLSGGFCLEHNHYGDHDEWELTAWGPFEPQGPVSERC